MKKWESTFSEDLLKTVRSVLEGKKYKDEVELKGGKTEVETEPETKQPEPDSNDDNDDGDNDDYKKNCKKREASVKLAKKRIKMGEETTTEGYTSVPSRPSWVPKTRPLNFGSREKMIAAGKASKEKFDKDSKVDDSQRLKKNDNETHDEYNQRLSDHIRKQVKGTSK
jgi:hypothetical protein